MHASAGSSGIAFEEETAALLRKLGWAVESTPKRGDFGADLIARAGRETLAVQCKNHRMPAGLGAVQEVYLAKAHYQTGSAMVVARNGYTRSATTAAHSASVYIIKPDALTPGGKWDRRTGEKGWRKHYGPLRNASSNFKQAKALGRTGLTPEKQDTQP